jgi:hypothetical protein
MLTQRLQRIHGPEMADTSALTNVSVAARDCGPGPMQMQAA